MGTCTSMAGTEAEGYSEIRSGNCEKCRIPFEVIEQPDEIPDIRRCPECGGNVGELLVAFSSKDAETYLGGQYQKERIKYAMEQRRKAIPTRYRTGQPCPVGTTRIIWEIVKLKLRRLYARTR